MSLFALAKRDEGCVGDEPFDGVVIERREVLGVSLGLLAALASRPTFAQEALSWDDLITTTTLLAERLVENPRPDEEIYLARLSALIERRTNTPQPFFNLAQLVATHQTTKRFPLQVLQFRLAPGAVIPYHDHRNYIGVLTVTDGSVRIRSFELEGSNAPPRDHIFQIRETDDASLTKGGQSSLTRTRGNIHDVRAGAEGARFIDFFTLFNESAQSNYLNVADEPRDPSRRVFDATWA